MDRDDDSGLDLAETVAAPASAPPSDSPLPPLPPPSVSDQGPEARRSTPETRGPRPEALPSSEHYDILGEHGKGGLGRILRARDRRTGRIVAIKEIIGDDETVIARFQREALVTANLQHPSIVPVYEVGRWPSGKPFYAMKLVTGRSLAVAIEQAGDLAGRLALLPHAAQVADALAYAHDQGWIHRDLKPANILVGDFGETVVIDWGLARRRRLTAADAEPAAPPRPPSLELPPSLDSDQTQAGTVVGTPVYMAPEQARGELVDARADVYAIGAVLYHVLGGVPPYRECKTGQEVIDKVARLPPRRLALLAPGAPVDLIAIVERAMARDQEVRYPTAAELAVDLSRFQAGALVEAHRYTWRERLRKFVSRHRGAVAVGMIAAAALAVISAVAIRNVIVARDTAEAERASAQLAQGRAVEERRVAERSLAALHRELGRAALADGAPGRALPHLARALRSSSADDRVLRVAVGLAADSLSGVRGVIEIGAPAARVAVEGGRAIASTWTERQVIWDLADGKRVEIPGYLGRLSPGGRLALTRTAANDAIEVRRADGGVPLAILNGEGHVYGEGFAAGDRVWVAFDSGLVRRWTVTDRAELAGSVVIRGGLHRVSVAPDGRHGVAAGNRGELWRFDLERGTSTLLTRGAPSQLVESVRAIDDRHVITFAPDEIAVWSGAGTRRVIRNAPHGASPVVSADGRLVIVWSARHGLRLLDVARAELGPALGDPGGEVVAAISNDAKLIATGNGDGEVAVWRASDGTELAAAPGHADAVTAIAFADERTVISAGAAGEVRTWRYDETSRTLAIHHDPLVNDGAFVGSDRIVTVGSDRLGRLTSVSGEPLATLRGHAEAIVQVDQVGGLVATCARDGSAQLWMPDGRAGAALGKPGEAAGRRAAGEACHVAVAAARVAVARDQRVEVYGLDGKRHREVDVEAPVRALAWSKDGARWIAVHDDRLAIWDAVSGARVAAVDAIGAPRGVEVASDRELAAIVTGGYELLVFSTKDGTIAWQHTMDKPMTALAWARDGTLVVATRGGRIDSYRATGQRLPSIRTGGDGPTALAIRADGDLIAVGGDRGAVELWDRDTSRLLARRAVVRAVTALRWSPDGNRLLVLTAGPEATVWDLSPWQGELDALDRLIRCRDPFQLDGDRLVAATPPTDCNAARFTGP